MSFVRIWVHVVFTTKNREPFLYKKGVRFKVFDHIKRASELKGIWVDCVNGYEDHAHCLLSLTSSQTLEDVVQSIKGESSLWINSQKNFLPDFFKWQDDYWAVSVGQKELRSIRKYIHSQEEHHLKVSLDDELEKLSRY